jgi:hypothetical protein
LSNHARRLGIISGVAAALLFILGCGQPTGEVSGKVTYKGEPVTEGSVGLRMKSKGIAQDAKLDGSGTYTMPAPLPVGTYQAYYVPPTVEPQDPKIKAPPPKIKSVVPKKHQDAQTSGVSVEVKTGKNDITIDFKD